MPATNQPKRDAPLVVRITPRQREALYRIAALDGATVSETIRRLVANEIRRRKITPPAEPTTPPATA